MTAHSHSFDGRWPFDEAENTAVFCCDHVFSGASILYVVHDHDGDWEFLCGASHVDDKPRLVCLGCMIEKDASLWSLADMPVGWGADRDDTDGVWNLEPNHEPSE